MRRERSLSLERNQQVLEEVSRLDGSYVLKTDLLSKSISKEMIHHRSKDLAHIERAFRTMKTGHLEVRPVFVRKESRTCAHVFVSMLAYRIVRKL